MRSVSFKLVRRIKRKKYPISLKSRHKSFIVSTQSTLSMRRSCSTATYSTKVIYASLCALGPSFLTTRRPMLDLVILSIYFSAKLWSLIHSRSRLRWLSRQNQEQLPKQWVKSTHSSLIASLDRTVRKLKFTTRYSTSSPASLMVTTFASSPMDRQEVVRHTRWAPTAWAVRMKASKVSFQELCTRYCRLSTQTSSPCASHVKRFTWIKCATCSIWPMWWHKATRAVNMRRRSWRPTQPTKSSRSYAKRSSLDKSLSPLVMRTARAATPSFRSNFHSETAPLSLLRRSA